MAAKTRKEAPPKTENILKSVDSATTVALVDPIAIKITYILAKIKIIHPNIITITGGITTILAAYSFVKGNIFAGSLLWYITYLLDCIDGKLARLTDRVSKLGGILDETIDNIGAIIIPTSAMVAINNPTFRVASTLWVLNYLISIIWERKNRNTRKASRAHTIKIFGRRAYLIPTRYDRNFLLYIVAPPLIASRSIVAQIMAQTISIAIIGIEIASIIIKIMPQRGK
ncbi:MAG: CDP-alcohol phosphatidyltransferase family protein [Candidatus Diapherotrites archaeon]|nr:CDP-alcohol phosphatidyltransferase family protein [Candidatus Diapherotrites archaeon]